MSLSQPLPSKHNCHPVFSGQTVLSNEGKVAASEKIAMYQLMEWAGAAVFTHIQQLWPQSQCMLILCGKGNNGGDGFVVARLAHAAGIKVEVLLTCPAEQLQGDALKAYQAMIKSGVDACFFENITKNIERFCGDIIVDALFGIGFRGELNADAKEWVYAINCHSMPVVSVDIPSGLCATTGSVQAKNAIIADLTVTFIAYKQGLLTGQAANFTGKVVLADLTLGKAFYQQVNTTHYCQFHPLLIAQHSPLKERLKTSHKGNIGQIITIGGNQGLPGAIRLASEAALRTGAALVAVTCHEVNQALVFNGRPELMLAPCHAAELKMSNAINKAKIVLIGPGLGQNSWAKAHFNHVINLSENTENHLMDKKWFVLDADALTLLAKKPHYCQHWVLTPHPKEAATLLNCSVETIEKDRFNAVRLIVKKYGGICVLKGAGSLICDGEQIVINHTGNAGMASGGMGDVLSGIIAGTLLQTHHHFAAVCLAVYIHGACGDIIAEKYGQRGMLASDLFTPLQQLINEY